MKVAIHKVTYADFHKHYGNIERLLEIALPLTMVVTRDCLALDSIRPAVEQCVRVSNEYYLAGHLVVHANISDLGALLRIKMR